VTDGVTVSEPVVVSAPDQPPLRVQELAFFEDQVRIEVAPAGILPALAVSVTLGRGATTGVTVTAMDAW
jgi:hypothetical protein